MFRDIQSFRKRLDDGETLVGIGVNIADPVVTEAVGPNVDFLWFDLEHNVANFHDMRNHLIAARATNTPMVVRSPSADEATIKRLLDGGVMGLVFPQIRTVDEVKNIVSACRYMPLGSRGWGPSRSADYGRMSGIDHIEEANRSVFVSVQIETKQAYESLDEILAVEGYDSVVIGPNDLACNYGRPGYPAEPENVDRMRDIATKARKSGKHVGAGMGVSTEFALMMAELGCNWLQVGSDYSYLVNSTNEIMGQLRKGLS
jgi:2-keto-3-deoxy-L-rhamnonate aldolase RhmA